MDAFEELMNKVIEKYKEFLNTTYALDYCKVQDKKLRNQILKNPEFQKETRAIKAQVYLRDIQNINKIYEDASKLDGNDEYDSGRGTVDTKAVKDAITLKLKATDIRRELLSMTNDQNSELDEAAINFYFVPVSEADIRKMMEEERIELHEGSEGDDDKLFDEIINSSASMLKDEGIVHSEDDTKVRQRKKSKGEKSEEIFSAPEYADTPKIVDGIEVYE